MICVTQIVINGEVLKLKTDSPIEDDLKLKISNFLEKLFIELNHNIEGSESYKFNASETIEVEDYFKEFLKINSQISKGYSGDFDPFLPKNTDAAFQIDGKKITKQVNFALDTSYLRTAFILDYLGKFLKDNGVKNFFIQFQNMLFALGDKEWVVSHDLLDGTYGINNEALIIVEYSVPTKKSSDVKSSRLIIRSDNLLTCKVESLKFPELRTIKEFRQYAEENNLSFIIFDEAGFYYQFP